MDIFLTDGDDNYVQSAAKIDEWNGYFGKNGNDSFKIYQGGVLGGAGNDRIEKLASPEWWRELLGEPGRDQGGPGRRLGR
jgi:hypothetical protein